ncbi:hypothetical protein BH11PLA2_BH11PLA2_29680 [soil metagenome]
MYHKHIPLMTCTLCLLGTGNVFAQANPAKADAITSENAPPSLTLYLPIALDVPGVENPSTGVFIPKDYRAGPTVDIVLYLRGYDIKRPKAATAVREYWGSPQHPTLKSFLLRDEVNASGKNVILVVPPLGPSSEFGDLKEMKGLHAFLEQILEGLGKHGPHAGLAKPPTLRHLSLAAHSGGGVALRRLALLLGKNDMYKDTLKECWGFDSIYGVRDKDAEFWSDWAKEHPGTKITMYYLYTEKDVGKDPTKPVSATNPADHKAPSGTSFPAMELDRLAKSMKLNNVIVHRDTKASHNEVPKTHLANLLKAAEYLEKR